MVHVRHSEVFIHEHDLRVNIFVAGKQSAINMFMTTIIEASEDDLRRSDLISDFHRACIKYLYHATYLPRIKIADKRYPTISGDEVFGAGIFGDVLIAFYDDYRNYSGRVLRSHGEYRYVVMLHVNDLEPKAIARELANNKQTFQHEFHHVLDLKRAKNKETIRGHIFKTDLDDSGQSISDDDLSGYYNNPLELNAYFNNLAEPLLERMRFIQKHGYEAYQLYPEIDNNFRDYFKNNVIEGGSWKYREYYRHLTDANKRKVIKRLSGLFELFQKIVEKYKSKEPITEQIKNEIIILPSKREISLKIGFKPSRQEIITLARNDEGVQLRGIIYKNTFVMWSAYESTHYDVDYSLGKTDEFSDSDTPCENYFYVRVNDDNSIVFIGNPDFGKQYIPNFTSLFDYIDMISEDYEYTEVPYEDSEWGLPARYGGWSYVIG